MKIENFAQINPRLHVNDELYIFNKKNYKFITTALGNNNKIGMHLIIALFIVSASAFFFCFRSQLFSLLVGKCVMSVYVFFCSASSLAVFTFASLYIDATVVFSNSVVALQPALRSLFFFSSLLSFVHRSTTIMCVRMP